MQALAARASGHQGRGRSPTSSSACDRRPRWWDASALGRFLLALADPGRAAGNAANGTLADWATAYRRTRQRPSRLGDPADSISGCLRTARGGSSKQALVEAGAGRSAFAG